MIWQFLYIASQKYYGSMIGKNNKSRHRKQEEHNESRLLEKKVNKGGEKKN